MSKWFDYTSVLRLEPDGAGDFAEGLRAAVADPVWFLGRQWQMNEHAGEDAATPVRVSLDTSTEAILPGVANVTEGTPFESLVEGEDNDWWTWSRRIRLGALLHDRFPDVVAELAPTDVPSPYDSLAGPLYDGLVIWNSLPSAPADLVDLVPAPRDSTWRSDRLAYEHSFPSGPVDFAASEHRGGDVDWWTVDAVPATNQSLALVNTLHRLPTRISFRGAPHPRWWQIEDSADDLGAHPPDRTHIGTLLLIELMASHSDDWFLLPLATKSGMTLTVSSLVVTDAFDRVITLSPRSDWSVFATQGLGTDQLVVFPSASTPLRGPVTDRVLFAVDQDANLAWGIERMALGRELSDPPEVWTTPVDQDGSLVAGGAHGYTYVPATGLRAPWRPYVITGDTAERRWVQATIDPDLFQEDPDLTEPGDLVNDHPSSAADAIHAIDADVISESGNLLERRWVLARDATGRPVLWRQRERGQLVEGASSGLRFDVAEPVPEIDST